MLVDWTPDRKTIFKKLKDKLANATSHFQIHLLSLLFKSMHQVLQSELFCNNGKTKIDDH